MRKITIVEVWDPIKEEYVSVKQGINQGLFDPQTYLFFSPKDDKYYSITEAAQRFMFKSAIDLRPESLIVERIKIAQTVALISARDPFNNKIISIVDAISCSVVDTNLRIYRFLNKNEVIGLNEAIDRDLIQVKVLKEITEKITETLTEEKSTSFGLIKKIETSSCNNLETNEAHHSQDNLSLTSVHDYDGLYTFDRTKSINVSKRIKKSDEHFAAGFISESDSKKIINQTSKRLKSILKSGSKSQAPIIDLNEAIRNNVVILPDSLIMKQNVKYVVDLKSNLRLDYDVACDMGIIDVITRLFLDTSTNMKLNLFEALKKNYIVMKDELYTNYEDNYMLYESIDDTTSKLMNTLNKKTRSLSTSSTSSMSTKQAYTCNDIVTLFNPITGEQVPIAKAIELGLFDSKSNKYIDFHRKLKTLNLDEAAEKGMAVLKEEKMMNQINEGYQFLHINGIINPITKIEMKLTEAIESGILDYTEGEFHDPDSGKTLNLLEAYERGYLITSVKNYTPTDSTTPSRIQMKPKQHLIDTQSNENFKIKKSLSCLDKVTPKMMDMAYDRSNQIDLNESIQSKSVKSHSQSPFRNSNHKRNVSASSERISLRGKSFDRFSFTSRSSILTKFKDKLFNKKNKNVQFDETLILESIRIVNKQTDEKYDLKSAIEMNLTKPDDQIKDIAEDKYLSILDAIKQQVLCFIPPQLNIVYQFMDNCYIYNQNLYLFNYILNPNDQHKMNLSEAFEKLILDSENAIYFGKKGPYSLESAIQKGYISCEVIDLNLLNNIITSNIFKYSNNNNTIDLHVINNELTEPKQPEQEPEPELPEQQEEDEVPEYLNQTRELAPLYNEQGYLSKSILQESGLKFSERKNYVITEIFDEETAEYLKPKEAIKLGIFNEENQEYVNSKTGAVIHLSLAIRRAKIKISNIKKITDKEFNRLFTDEIKEFNKSLATKNATFIDEVSCSNTNSAQNDSNRVEQETNQDYSKINDSPTFTSSETKPNSSNFDLIQCLLYKKPTNGKYIRFDKVLRNKLYDFDTKLIKDISNNEFIPINEALHRGVLRINDSDILFDKQNVYKIDTIFTGLNKNTLSECLKKKQVSRKDCVLKYMGNIYSIRDAMREGLIEGRIITDSEMKLIIDEFYLKYEEKKRANVKENKPLIELLSIQTNIEMITNNGEDKFKENLSCEFYIFDSESELYISINEAFAKSLLISEPIRIRDPTTKSYILLRDAIVKGLVSCEKSKQKVSFKNRSSFYTINRVSYIIDAIYDPQSLNSYSLQDAIKLGLFKNGLYIQSKELTYPIDEAITMNLILGKKVELDKIDILFKECLAVPPIKPLRGIFVEPMRKNSNSSNESTSKRSKYGQSTGATLRKQEPERNEAKIGRIELVKDVKNGTYLNLDEALEAEIINFNKGLFINTSTTNTIDIQTAIEKGFIIMDYQASNFVNRPSFEARSRSLSQRSKKTIKSTDQIYKQIDDLNDSEIIKVGRQFIITGVLDPINRVLLELEDAIRIGLFDIDCAMYNDPRIQKKLTLVDAIDQGLIKIADETFQASYKLTVEEENEKRYFKSLKTYSIRYIVHPITKQIVPLNIAVDKNLINLDNGTYLGYEKIITLKEAFDKCLALTVDDLDQPDSKRNKYKVAFVRKSTTGKNMSLKSALAKNWLNFGRRVYIDKQTNQEIPFSQAIDMDLLVLLGNFDEKPFITNLNDHLKPKQSIRLARKSHDSSSNESFKNSTNIHLRGATSGLRKFTENNNSNRLGVY